MTDYQNFLVMLKHADFEEGVDCETYYKDERICINIDLRERNKEQVTFIFHEESGQLLNIVY